MHMKTVLLCGALTLFGITVTGCSDSQDVTLHKPGVYKGPTDPLVEKQRTAEQQDALLARFKQVQTDR